MSCSKRGVWKPKAAKALNSPESSAGKRQKAPVVPDAPQRWATIGTTAYPIADQIWSKRQPARERWVQSRDVGSSLRFSTCSTEKPEAESRPVSCLTSSPITFPSPSTPCGTAFGTQERAKLRRLVARLARLPGSPRPISRILRGANARRPRLMTPEIRNLVYGPYSKFGSHHPICHDLWDSDNATLASSPPSCNKVQTHARWLEQFFDRQTCRRKSESIGSRTRSPRLIVPWTSLRNFLKDRCPTSLWIAFALRTRPQCTAPKPTSSFLPGSPQDHIALQPSAPCPD